jgi:3-oxoacyl-(acyl-carrier-protein) synthase
MSVQISGMGWVTPLGRDVDSVWQRLLHGDEPIAQEISDRISERKYLAFLVPSDSLKTLPPHPRLRRASAISRFAAAAGLDALANAKSNTGEIDMRRTALVFAASNGGVVYTKRFYHDIVEAGAQTASPLLFPETVFNAPASHLAAILGITGASYTSVGDGAVGILAIKLAADLLDAGQVDHCLVVAAEEADWILCDAYAKWRLLKAKPPIEAFRKPPRGTILSEGAGAIVLGSRGSIRIDAIDPGSNFFHRQDAGNAIRSVVSKLAEKDAIVISSANGTFVDLAELEAGLGADGAKFYSPKCALGESVGASALWQVIIAAQALKTERLPAMPHAIPRRKKSSTTQTEISSKSAVIVSCGLNQQVAGLRVSA